MSTAPFGLPDVPDVKRTTAGSVGRAVDRLPRLLRQPAGYDRLVDDQRDAGQLDALGDLGRGEEKVERNRDRADAPDREQRRDEPGPVREEERNAVVAGNATRSKHGLSRPRPCEELVVGHDPVVDVKGGSLAVLPRGCCKNRPEAHNS